MRLVRGTRLLLGPEADRRREILSGLIQMTQQAGYQEVVLPSLEIAAVYAEKAGSEILSQDVHSL